MVATGILAGVYFGVRLVSLFDTRVKIDDPGDTPEACYNSIGGDNAVDEDWAHDEDVATSRGAKNIVADDSIRRSERKRSVMPERASDISIKNEIDSDSNVDIDNDMDIDTDGASDYVGDDDSDSDSDSESATDSDTGSTADGQLDDDNCTDDGYDGGAEETGAFLYRHFTIFLVPNPVPGKPNIIFMKATLLHTKGEDNNPRM